MKDYISPNIIVELVISEDILMASKMNFTWVDNSNKIGEGDGEVW